MQEQRDILKGAFFMKKITRLILSMILCIVLLAGCSCKHEWTAPNCISPAVCSKCGETQGEALGHQYVEATCTQPRYCSVCGATFGNPLGHDWTNADCTTPKTCNRCGETEGGALGHEWSDATCDLPKTCVRCGDTEGKALGHTVAQWNTTQAATCSAKGIETGVCTVCGKEVTQELDMVEHSPSEWEVETVPTKTTKGVRVKKCKVCGAIIEREMFELSEEELKNLYISECKTISFDSLARTPEQYKGEKVRFNGRVVQVCSEAESSQYYSTYRVSVGYSRVIYLKVDNYGSGSRILENDWITFYGEFDGLYTYQSVRGDSITIPSVIAEYID